MSSALPAISRHSGRKGNGEDYYQTASLPSQALDPRQSMAGMTVDGFTGMQDQETPLQKSPVIPAWTAGIQCQGW